MLGQEGKKNRAIPGDDEDLASRFVTHMDHFAPPGSLAACILAAVGHGLCVPEWYPQAIFCIRGERYAMPVFGFLAKICSPFNFESSTSIGALSPETVTLSGELIQPTVISPNLFWESVFWI